MEYFAITKYVIIIIILSSIFDKAYVSSLKGKLQQENDINGSVLSFSDLNKYLKPYYDIARESNTSSINENITIDDLIYPYVIPSVFFKDYTVEVNRTTEYIFEYVYNTSQLKNKALRVEVHCPSSIYMYPLLVVVRQQREVLSWQLPLKPSPNTFTTEKYRKISRTLCRLDNDDVLHKNIDLTQRLFVDVTTSSAVFLNFSVKVKPLEKFLIGMEEPMKLTVSPGEPYYFLFKFPENITMVLVKATSEDDICAMVSIQNISCPVFDTEENIRYANFYQTMTLKAGITVRRENYPKGFYVVLLTLSNDVECSPHYEHIYLHREKDITLLVEEKITSQEYLVALMAGVCFCASFYIVAAVIACAEYIRAKRRARLIRSPGDEAFIRGRSEDVHPSLFCEGTSGSSSNEPCAISVCSSLSEEDYDVLEDVESEKDVFRTKKLLFVSDLARKNPRVLQHKSFLYILGLLTIAIFYGVPAVQLVVTYQKVLDETGNQDICFYNFWCSNPLGALSDFNHVYSNIAYILFGILFNILSYRKERRHKKASAEDSKLDKECGIPQHYGMFYAMGCALTMEGLLSACYHICPNHSNFQFDTAFMYVIAVLCMLKIYQNRHPDVNASANATYLVLAISVLLGVIGVLSGRIYFWIFFAIIHFGTCFLLSSRVYYMGRWSIDLNWFRRVPSTLRRELVTWKESLRPQYLDRMVLLLLANAANWGLSIYGVVTTPRDFASYLLVIFLTNLLLYTGFYIIMKVRHGEKVLKQPLIYLLLSMFSWGAAAYFFLVPRTSWEMTPAHSRQYNRNCSLLHFYDTHDIWHFLSSAAMFFGFMLLLTLDDDLTFVKRDKIPVF